MSVQSVKELFENAGLGELLLCSEVSADTVEHAAQMIGCDMDQIAKTMSFYVDGEPIVIVVSGCSRIDNAKYKAFFHTKAKMIPFDEVEQATGHLPGGVCPFALKSGVRVYLDISLKKHEVVFAGAGDEYNTVKVTIPHLERFSEYTGWIDVCKI